MQTVQAQLSSLALQQKENLIEDSVNERIFALEQEQQSLQLEIDQCLEQRAALLMEKEQLLNDEKYGQLLQQFEQEKTELQQLIEQWATKKRWQQLFTKPYSVFVKKNYLMFLKR